MKEKRNVIIIPGYNLLGWKLKEMYSKLIESLSDKYRVLIFDYNMHADSIESIFNAFDSFLKKKGITSCDLICNSYGTYITLKYLTERKTKLKIGKIAIIAGLINGSRLFRLYYYHDLLSRAKTGSSFREAVYDNKNKYNLPKNIKVLAISGDKRSGKHFMGNIFQKYGLLGVAFLTFDLRTTDGILSIDESTLEGYENKIIHANHITLHDDPETISVVKSFLKR